jgi:hypothetical protein
MTGPLFFWCDVGLSSAFRPQMKINLRQEIAMWVLGLLWTGLGLAAVVGTEERRFGRCGCDAAYLAGSCVPHHSVFAPVTNRTAMRKPETRS